jgi:hypothetical protein
LRKQSKKTLEIEITRSQRKIERGKEADQTLRSRETIKEEIITKKIIREANRYYSL